MNTLIHSFVLTSLLLSAPADAGKATRIIKDIEFARVDGHSLKLDLYLPTDTSDSSLVVWIHGGGWRGGSKKGCPVRWLTSHNYAVASLDFRLSDEARFPAQVHDCKGAIRWLRANAERFGCDGRRIAVIGGSSGGHLVALVGTTNGVRTLEGNVGANLGHSSRVQAIVDMYGMTDLFYNATVESTRCDLPDCPLYQLLGGKPSQRLQEAKAASPVFHVSFDDPPLLILLEIPLCLKPPKFKNYLFWSHIYKHFYFILGVTFVFVHSDS